MHSCKRAVQFHRAFGACLIAASRSSASFGAREVNAAWSRTTSSKVGVNRVTAVYDLVRRGARVFTRRYYADLPSHRVVPLPALSPTMETGTLVSWDKEEGEELAEGDVLAQIETDKAVMDMETPCDGYLAKILVPAATKDLALGTPLCIVVDEEGDIPSFKDYQPPTDKKTPSPPPAQPAPVPSSQTTSPIVSPSDAIPKVQSSSSPSPLSSSTGVARRIFASPYAKTVAAAQNINLTNVQGTGADGRIVSSDVIGSQESVHQASAPVYGSYTDLDVSSMRKTIAKRLQESKQSIPHYYLTVDVDMTKTLNLRQLINVSHQQDELKLSPNDFVIKAAALALRKVPEVNSSWMETVIRHHHNVDISVAVSTEGGLITPIVFGADNKGLRAINQDVLSLAKKARNGQLQPNEYMGGTFTISNLGMYGVRQFTAIINPPQSCILAVGACEKRTVPSTNQDDSKAEYRVADMMTVTMSCDHRVVDGAMGAQWLSAFKIYLEEPSTMLL